jgi:hypothetical protein
MIQCEVNENFSDWNICTNYKQLKIYMKNSRFLIVEINFYWFDEILSLFMWNVSNIIQRFIMIQCHKLIISNFK